MNYLDPPYDPDNELPVDEPEPVDGDEDGAAYASLDAMIDAMQERDDV